MEPFDYRTAGTPLTRELVQETMDRFEREAGQPLRIEPTVLLVAPHMERAARRMFELFAERDARYRELMEDVAEGWGDGTWAPCCGRGGAVLRNARLALDRYYNRRIQLECQPDPPPPMSSEEAQSFFSGPEFTT